MIAPAARAKRRTASSPPPAGYLAESERPWVSLAFLLPLVGLYELYAIGVIGGQPTHGGATRAGDPITAFVLLEELFRLFGAAGRHLPALALAAMLLGAHLARKDAWRFSPVTLVGMAAESVGWAVPLVILGWAMAKFIPLADASEPIGTSLVQCLGAGIYEEMLFRLIGVSLLTFALHDLVGLNSRTVMTITLVALSLLFAFYHYLSPAEHFRLRPFLFRTLAGGFLGVVFVLRGFGVTAGSHAVYDLVAVSLLGG